MANCFFLIRSIVDRYKIIKTAYSLRVGDFGFSPSPRDVYYQFYKNAPITAVVNVMCHMTNDYDDYGENMTCGVVMMQCYCRHED